MHVSTSAHPTSDGFGSHVSIRQHALLVALTGYPNQLSGKIKVVYI
jgi:hypothetical protein